MWRWSYFVAGACTVCVLEVWTRKFSWQAQGIVRLRVAVKVKVAVTLGLACGRVLFGGAGISKLLGRADVCVVRWGFPLDFWRKSGCRLEVVIFEEVS